MTLASDQNRNEDRLSATSRRMLALREAVFAEWEARVRAALPQAGTLLHPILIDTLPPFYDNIAESVTPDYPRASAVDGSTLAAEHGGERARLTLYDHQSLIGEYQILRWAIFDVLYREGVPLAPAEVVSINASVDAAIKEAVHAFALVGSALRERFAAALAHDLRTPLGIALMTLDLLGIIDDPAERQTAIAKARESLERMDGMIHELLDTMIFHTGQRLTLSLTPFEVGEVVREVQAARSARDGARLHVLGQPVAGWWDRAAIKRAVENMVGNALKYGSRDTPVTVKIDEVHGRLLLTVHNEGAAIPVEEQEDIFQLYRRADAAKEGPRGWGVGLSYVRAVAESHGGSIGLDSSAERGTTFMLDIPVDCRPFKDVPSVASPL